MNTNEFPSDLSKTYLSRVGLYPLVNIYDLKGEELEYAADLNQRAIQFQSLSMVDTFEVALSAYYGMHLDADQTDALLKIYEHTKPYVKSIIAFKMIGRIDDPRSGIEASKLLMDIINGDVSGLDAQARKFVIEVVQ